MYFKSYLNIVQCRQVSGVGGGVGGGGGEVSLCMHVDACILNCVNFFPGMCMPLCVYWCYIPCANCFVGVGVGWGRSSGGVKKVSWCFMPSQPVWLYHMRRKRSMYSFVVWLLFVY